MFYYYLLERFASNSESIIIIVLDVCVFCSLGRRKHMNEEYVWCKYFFFVHLLKRRRLFVDWKNKCRAEYVQH